MFVFCRGCLGGGLVAQLLFMYLDSLQALQPSLLTYSFKILSFKKLTPQSLYIAFLCINFFQISFFSKTNHKIFGIILFSLILGLFLSAKNFFSRHVTFQKRQFGANRARVAHTAD